MGFRFDEPELEMTGYEFDILLLLYTNILFLSFLLYSFPFPTVDFFPFHETGILIIFSFP